MRSPSPPVDAVLVSHEPRPAGGVRPGRAGCGPGYGMWWGGGGLVATAAMADEFGADLVWYFAYGSNMQAATFAGRRGIRWRRAVAARITGWELVIDKPSLLGMQEAFANVVPAPAAVTYGVAYEIAPADLEHVELTEGVKLGNYARASVHAEILAPSPGSLERVPAYTLTSELRRPDLKPSTRYMTLLLDGARSHGLPNEWLDRLAAIPTCVEDADSLAMRARLDGLLRQMRPGGSGSDS